MFLLVDYDVNHYSTSIKIEDGKRINWVAARAQDVLVIQYPYGQNLDLNYLINLLNQNNYFLRPEYIALNSDIYVRYVSVADKARNKGCPINGAGCSYMILSCNKEGTDVLIYRPENNKTRRTTCEVPLKMKVFVKHYLEVERRGITGILTTGILRGRDEIDFYGLSFEPSFSSGYHDGDIYYVINNRDKQVRIPITNEMIFNNGGEIFIKYYKPEILSDSRIISIEVEEM